MDDKMKESASAVSSMLDKKLGEAAKSVAAATAEAQHLFSHGQQWMETAEASEATPGLLGQRASRLQCQRQQQQLSMQQPSLDERMRFACRRTASRRWRTSKRGRMRRLAC